MQKRHTTFEFIALLLFLVFGALVLTNGFVARIFAQDKVDVFAQITPVGDVLDKIMDEYVKEPDINKVVEGAIIGMMNSLDRHSSYISAEALKEMKEDTKGEFEGIGVSIRFDDDNNIVVFQPIADSPAAKAGVQAGDLIVKIDGVVTTGMALEDAAKRIRGQRDTMVNITLYRRHEGAAPEILELSIKRGNIPLDSIKEARLLKDGVGYIRVSDFKDTTARDLGKNIKQLCKDGMKSLVLDLRWNPGGLLTASKDACEVFLPKNTLVTYTQGRKGAKNSSTEDMKLFTDREPLLPKEFPVIVLVNEQSASSSEIVTGALQFWSRAIIVGQKTYGKGSVQTIIPLDNPEGSALRLTTALYYTPAEVTIDSMGILPDVEVKMPPKEQVALFKQMYESYKDDAGKVNQQNHGAVTGNEPKEGAVEAPQSKQAVTGDEPKEEIVHTGTVDDPLKGGTKVHLVTGDEPKEGMVEDVQLKRAVEILTEDPVFDKLLAKYHKDTHETQVAAPPDKVLQQGHVADDHAEPVSPETGTPVKGLKEVPVEQPKPESAP